MRRAPGCGAAAGTDGCPLPLSPQSPAAGADPPPLYDSEQTHRGHVCALTQVNN
jgi:hypothetical protein